MRHKQLTDKDRFQISVLHNEGVSNGRIAKIIGKNRSSIGRELSRNAGNAGYRPEQAHIKANRRRGINARIIEPSLWLKVEEKLREGWSPEQISSTFEAQEIGKISHQAIYRYVRDEKHKGGNLWRCLRCKKKRRKVYGSVSKKGGIPNRVGIEKRPSVVEMRERIGDWEIDTIIGKNHQQAIVTVVERKTGFTLMQKVANKTAEAVGDALIALLKPFKNKVLTITADNGLEFAQHERVAQALDADFYFARPYASWQRGTNENTNGLIREYFPKGSDFVPITQKAIDHAIEKLNSRPRKRLGFLPPRQVFFA